MSLRTQDVDRVFDKLEMEVKVGKDVYALFYHKGKLITRTKRSLGRGKIDDEVRHLIRQQLKLSDTEFSGVIGCSLERKHYVDILKRKGWIS